MTGQILNITDLQKTYEKIRFENNVKDLNNHPNTIKSDWRRNPQCWIIIERLFPVILDAIFWSRLQRRTFTITTETIFWIIRHRLWTSIFYSYFSMWFWRMFLVDLISNSNLCIVQKTISLFVWAQYWSFLQLMLRHEARKLNAVCFDSLTSLDVKENNK